MDLSNTPTPIVYSLSAVLLLIGLAVAYQVAVGSNLEYDGPLGSIKVGTGENQTTLDGFVQGSEEALTVAQETISQQEGIIDRLKAAVANYQQELAKLKRLTNRISSTGNANQRADLSSLIQLSVASLDRSAKETSRLGVDPKILASRKMLSEHVLLTQAIKADIESKSKSK